MPPRIRPIEKFAAAVSQCSVEASVYGKCIVADYNHVHKDMCLTEFMRLKECYMVGSGQYSCNAMDTGSNREQKAAKRKT